ncbi:MAG: prohibitin family protein [Candidatus Methylacidiphilales bacterium]
MTFIFGILLLLAGCFVIFIVGGKPRVPGFLMVAVGLLAVMFSMIRIVPTGHVGVVALFGKVDLKKSYGEGMHLINPLLSINNMSVRMESMTMRSENAIQALSSDGLSLPMDITVNYRLDPDLAAWVYQNLGDSQRYRDNVIIPAVREGVREAAANFTAQEAYSSRREELSTRMAEKIRSGITDLLVAYHLEKSPFFTELKLRDVGLPPNVRAAIERKLQEEQEASRMDFVLEKEQKEAERKRIEAEGIQKFQEIVSKGIDEKLLRWRGIEATKQLAESQNAKIVVIGAGADGLPLILGK